MPSGESKNSGAHITLPRPVERALRSLGQDISTARRTRRLSQENLAERIGTSVSTVRRMEDGHPGTALHTFLRALHVLGRLDAVVQVMAMKNDVLGMELVREQLPQRVRTSRGQQRVSGPNTVTRGAASGSTDELEGF